MTEERGKGVFFIIGIRRSGTSVLRTIISKAPGIECVLFEPHELYHSIQMQHFDRFKSDKHLGRINAFRPQEEGKIVGLKMAMNPGIDALDWIWLPKTYPQAKIIFIWRNMKDTYASYYKEDCGSVRGIITETVYSPMFQWLWGSFFDFYQHNQDRSVVVNYDKMIMAPEKTLAIVWELLGVTAPANLPRMVRAPRHSQGANKVDSPHSFIHPFEEPLAEETKQAK